MPTMSHLLRCSPDMPLEVKHALARAEESRSRLRSEAWRRYAARLLRLSFGLDERDSFELVDLDSHCGHRLAA